MSEPRPIRLRRGRLATAVLTALACGEPTAPQRLGDIRSPMLVGTNLNGVSRLYTLTPDRGDSAEVGGMHTRVRYAAWSPDRKRIAFVDGDTAIMLSAADGRGPVTLFHTRQWRLGKVAWAPDGRRIAFDGVARAGEDAILAVVTVGTGAVREILRGAPAYALEPSWSPDGRRLMYSAVVRGDRQLHVMNEDGTRARRLTDDPAYWGEAEWSPDGARVVFVSARAGPIELWLADADGSRPRRLTDATGVLDQSPSWSPDSRAVAFVRHHVNRLDLKSSVMTMSVAGGAPRTVGFEGYASYVSW